MSHDSNSPENSDSFLSDDEEDLCPLCVEEMDITDKNFWPCPCGYQVCQFCYNNIRTNPELNGKCPACRRPYEDKNIEYKSISAEEWKANQSRVEKRKREKRQVEKERKDAEQAKRHHLAGMRVIQQNLVYVVGLNPPCSSDELSTVLRSDKYFGQYGKISKIVINKRNPNSNNPHHNSNPGYGVYVTFARKEDASKCIAAVDGSVSDGRVLRAAHGTTKYCSSYLRGQPCPNPNCMFLHEPGEEADSYTRQDLSTRSINKKLEERSATNGLIGPGPQQSHSNAPEVQEEPQAYHEQPHYEEETTLPGLPPTASWAKLQLQQAQQQAAEAIADPAASSETLSAFPTLGDAILQKPTKVPTTQLKKKEKKDKDSHSGGSIDETVQSFRMIEESIKALNSLDEFSYTIRPSYRLSPQANLKPAFAMFHQFDMDSLDKSLVDSNSLESRQHMMKLIDSLLFVPFSKNYNHKTTPVQETPKAAATPSVQPSVVAAAAAAAAAAQTSQFYQPQPQRYQNTIISQTKQQPSQLTQQFLQQQFLQEQHQMKLKQAQDLQAVQAHLQHAQQIAQQTQSTATPPPPGLFPGGGEGVKTNSAELLSQLMGGKKVAA